MFISCFGEGYVASRSAGKSFSFFVKGNLILVVVLCIFLGGWVWVWDGGIYPFIWN